VRFLKILIETNIFISIAAVAFLWANVLLLGLNGALAYLSLQVFFSTWFVYQVSRWIYFKKGAYTGPEEWVLKWFERHPRFSQLTIAFSGISAIIFTCLLKWKTILVLVIIGGISILYPIPFLKPLGIKKRLRDFPFIKIFLIALVWSVTSVLLPALETNIDFGMRKDVLVLWIAQFIFILFITLPFDINDSEVDKLTDVKTIPIVFGNKRSKLACFALGTLYAALMLYVYMLENWRTISATYITAITIVLIWLLCGFLQAYTFTRSDKVNKWMIKVVYDGSMIAYFLIVYLTLK
jgi:4-hydroxybenzoate polyprenyltransferase